MLSCVSYLRRLCLLVVTFTYILPCFSDLPSETLYLTWQRQPDTTMTIQWISLTEDLQDQIYYRLPEDKDWQQITGSHFPLSPSPYLLHRVEITQLQPNTLYHFKLPGSEQAYAFQTMPATLDQPVSFVSGGDMYQDDIENMKRTGRQAAKANPSFAIVGGDIAYAIRKPYSSQQHQRWVDWVKAWHESMITPEGRLIPVLAAIGNHDLLGHFDQTPAQAQIFSLLFPMPGERVYNVLDFGSYMSLFLLDSGHANPVSGKQVKWLAKALEERQNQRYRFAVYHVPAYPSIRNFHNRRCAAVRRHWIPLFEKGQIDFAFEHHDHAYKRTHPILNNRLHSEGIIYLGDGAWGVTPRQSRSNKKHFYLARTAAKRHFILIQLTQDQKHLRVIDEDGNVLDEAYIPAKSLAKAQQTT